jgi:hypothetical protein
VHLDSFDRLLDWEPTFFCNSKNSDWLPIFTKQCTDTSNNLSFKVARKWRKQKRWVKIWSWANCERLDPWSNSSVNSETSNWHFSRKIVKKMSYRLESSIRPDENPKRIAALGEIATKIAVTHCLMIAQVVSIIIGDFTIVTIALCTITERSHRNYRFHSKSQFSRSIVFWRSIVRIIRPKKKRTIRLQRSRTMKANLTLFEHEITRGFDCSHYQTD